MKFYTADCHFEHENVVTKMGRNIAFKDIAEHDQQLLEHINSMVDSKDELYVLGDFAWKRPQYWRLQIRCKHIKFVIGNHDKRLASQQTFGTVHEILVSKFSNGDKVILCHYPMLFWPSSHYGAYHLYGHMHARRESWINNLLPERRSMDVGVDNAKRLLGKYKPFTEIEILEILHEQPGHDPINYYRSSE